jgi:hypothetical protein
MLGGVFALPMTETRRPPANLPDGADNDADGLEASPAIAAAASMIALASSTHIIRKSVVVVVVVVISEKIIEL